MADRIPNFDPEDSIREQAEAELTGAVVVDSIKNVFFAGAASGFIIGLSKIWWWLGVIPFWIFLLVIAATILTYIFAFLTTIVSFFGGKGSWSMVVQTLFKLAESTVVILLIVWLWKIFY